MTLGRFTLSALVFATVAIASPSAFALTVDAASIGSGRGCVDAGCLGQTLAVDPAGSVGGAGTLTFGALDTFSFDITVPLTIYRPPGTDDNGVTQLDFIDAVFTGSGSTGPGTTSDLDLSGTASVSGNISPTGAGAAGPFAFTEVAIVGSCNGSGSNYLCGIIFSAQPDGNLELNGETRYFTQTLNLRTIPEPGTALLLGTGLALLAGRRRR